MLEVHDLVLILGRMSKEVLLSLCLTAFNHHKFNFIHLFCVVRCPLLDDSQVFKIPKNDCAIMRSRYHIPIALADLNVYNHVLVAVQRGLQYHIVLVPDFDDSILIETKVNFTFYIKF